VTTERTHTAPVTHDAAGDRRRHRPRRRSRPSRADAGAAAASGGVDLTPLIDVVLLLIVFFIVVSRIAEHRRPIGPPLPRVPDASVDAFEMQGRLVLDLLARSEAAAAPITRVRIDRDEAPATAEGIARLLADRTDATATTTAEVVAVRAPAATPYADVHRVLRLVAETLAAGDDEAASRVEFIVAPARGPYGAEADR